MAHVSHKLKSALEGALAGGGDPATSPLYVFGPFLRLIVVAGVANITFGASVWLVVLTIAVVSAMYRLVMRWVTDGSGGSGLSEEEFGSWAVKVNAAITFIEYTLTFLVSMAAMVTFIADRMPVLNEAVLGIQYRTIVAIALSILTGWVVNRGPKVAARTFGPATAGVLLLLWIMVIATIAQRGFHLPTIDLRAFNSAHFNITLGGYVRILAVMTGIEVFANLVAAYDGTNAEKSRKAFSSLLIIMGTTAITMLIVGPAIFELSDPTITEVSVFTQTMDKLLPDPLPILGTFVGIAVLMSASAASAQGLQNLALGLKDRRYIPPLLGQRNEYDVADRPVWIEVAIVCICFMLFGTNEETYLAIYAAGVFILLSMTGWAVTKRLVRELGESFSPGKLALIFGTVIAATLTTGATAIIFEERFAEGAWTYLVFIPILYMGFSYTRAKLGVPSTEMDYLGRFNAAQLAGFGFGQMAPAFVTAETSSPTPSAKPLWQPEPIELSKWRGEKESISRIAILLDGSVNAAQALPIAKKVAKKTGSKLYLLSAVKRDSPALVEQFDVVADTRRKYLQSVILSLNEEGIKAEGFVRPGHIAEATQDFIAEKQIDLVVTSTSGKSGARHWLSGGVSRKLIHSINKPVILVHIPEDGRPVEFDINRIVVALDGSIKSEQVLPYARMLAQSMGSELVLLSVPQVPEVTDYRAPADVIQSIRTKAESSMRNFLDAIARSLRENEITVKTVVQGSMPARTVVSIAEEEDADLIMITSRGRGGLNLLFIGSVAQRIVQHTAVPVFILPTQISE